MVYEIIPLGRKFHPQQKSPNQSVIYPCGYPIWTQLFYNPCYWLIYKGIKIERSPLTTNKTWPLFVEDSWLLLSLSGVNVWVVKLPFEDPALSTIMLPVHARLETWDGQPVNCLVGLACSDQKVVGYKNTWEDGYIPSYPSDFRPFLRGYKSNL